MFLCITILKLFLNDAMLVLDIIKTVAVSRFLLKKNGKMVYIDYRWLNAGFWIEAEPMSWVDNILERV